MIFAEYVSVLKKYFKQPISNDELCGILFDVIIFPADLKNRNGEIFTLDKAEVSRIMNRKKNIPKKLQEHVWDKKIQDGLENYFEKNIVAELVPDTADLSWQLMKLIDEDKNISSENKNKFRLLAEKNLVSSFLAKAFVYAIRQENKSAQENQIEPQYSSLCDKIRTRIFQLYAEISFPTPEEKLIMRLEKFFLPKGIFIGTLSFPVKINERVQKTIRDFAGKIRFNLPEDFFDLHGIRRTGFFGKGKIIGNEYGKRKFQKINSLIENINCYDRFESCYL